MSDTLELIAYHSGPQPQAPVGTTRISRQFARAREGLASDLALLDIERGEVEAAPAVLASCDWAALAEMARGVAEAREPRLLWEHDPLVLLAIPLCGAAPSTDCVSEVAVGLFLTAPITTPEIAESAARALGCATAELSAWAQRQTPVSESWLLRTAGLLVASLHSAAEVETLRTEADGLAGTISNTYEEISLLYRLTQNLKLSADETQLGNLALEWLSEVVPAKGLALWLERHIVEDTDGLAGPSTELLAFGELPLSEEEFQALVEFAGDDAQDKPLIVNRRLAGQRLPQFPVVRELILTPLTEGERSFGWLAAFNHADDGEFGSEHGNLLSSVSAILGIHSCNIELYREQAELFAAVVRALTSAIDAKDRYTCGHSDRVARIAVRLGQELGHDADTLKTIYLGGLLHDVGKIGISDAVLGKPGRLTAEEYDHIKTHVEIGFNILKDLRQLDMVLPIVRHHHESWDGSGYPHGLTEMNIPELARLLAVADAYDAMASDRPYRAGMPDEKLDEILRAGAGTQWDPQVVAAFFAARDDIRAISDRESVEPAPAGV